MRAVLQRVVQASVDVNGQQISKIGKGICVLIGLSVSDTSADLDYMVKKLLSVKVFDSHTVPEGETADLSQPNKPWAKSVVDIGGEILCVSQFTLYGHVLKGSKPDFHMSMKSDTSRAMYHDFLDRLKKAYNAEKIKDGEFGAMMLVNIANDGPVTLELDSRKFEYLPTTPDPKANKKAASAASAAKRGVDSKLNSQPSSPVVPSTAPTSTPPATVEDK
ncbi:D-tyrosyl-tRNA(Tyr) deacylase [Actinomortierella wolfii]|nr:D-tyrosyl-tRNA(Tyr) deacylase [Actinomortierella wolfii]